MIAYTVPLFLRGRVITDDLVSFDTRVGAAQFHAPDMGKHVERLPLRSPAEMSDLYALSFGEILDVLEALGDALDFESNAYLQEAYEASLVANVLPAEMLKNSYRVLRPLFSRGNVNEIADTQVGLHYLNGWVPHKLRDGRELRVRAFGSRTLHIPAGNGGLISAVTILRSVITRSDVIIKAPSNDPLTAIAIARTLADVAPDHPITKHLVVGYWKGGDRRRRRSPLPTAPHREDRRLGRVGVGQARNPVHPARFGTHCAGPQTQRHDHRPRGLRRRTHDARGGPPRCHRHRRGQPGRVRQRPGHLRAQRHGRRGPGQRQPARRTDLPRTVSPCLRSSAPHRVTPTASCSTTSTRPGWPRTSTV